MVKALLTVKPPGARQHLCKEASTNCNPFNNKAGKNPNNPTPQKKNKPKTQTKTKEDKQKL